MAASIRQIRIMISSTRADLAQYRSEAASVIRQVAAEKEKRVQLMEVSMEKETQSGDSEYPVAVSERWVEESDWVLLIVAWHYGTIAADAGAEGRSVTEREYRHAFKLGKKIFVFIAGEAGTANRYRVSDEEKEDLKDWIPKQTEDQRQKLAALKQDLGNRHADMFRDLAMFRERLQKTLRDAVDDLPPDIEPDTPLGDLIVNVTPEIRECTRRVKVIASSKRIHDHLHEVLQNVVRRLREEVLPVWKEEGKLSDSKKLFILGRLANAQRHLGGIEAERRAIGPEHQALRVSVDAVLRTPAPWDADADAMPGLDQFTEAVENLASAVQDAFSEADRSMTVEEGDLRERYQTLLERLRNARKTSRLSAADQQRLDVELDNVESNRSRVKESLIAHHDWQQDHDKLAELDGLRETSLFARRLAAYCGPALTNLTQLVEKSLAQARVRQAAAPGTPAAAALLAADDDPPPPSNELIEMLQRLGTRLETLGQSRSVAAFDEMRRPFDDAFYCLDKNTKHELQRAQRRSEAVEQWLDQLRTPAPATDAAAAREAS